MKTIAQLSYIPLATEKPTEKVQELLEQIAQYDLEIEVGYLSTTVVGETDLVFNAIRDIYDSMTLEREKFRLHVELLCPERETSLS